MTRVWLRHEGRCWYQCCTPHQLSWRDMQAPNSNHSAHSWWPRWSTGSQLQGKSQQNGRLAYQTPNNTQYINISILCLKIFEISIMSEKMATPSSELECDTYASMPTACQTKKTTLHDKMVTPGHADNLGDHLPTLAMYFVSSLDLQNSVYLESTTMGMFCGLCKGQQNLSGNIVRILHYSTLHYITLHVRMHA